MGWAGQPVGRSTTMAGGWEDFQERAPGKLDAAHYEQRGTSTERWHDNHTLGLHMHRKLKQVSAHLQTHTYTHT